MDNTSPYIVTRPSFKTKPGLPSPTAAYHDTLSDPAMPTYPLRALCRLDSETDDAWFVSVGDGNYVKFPLTPNVLPVIVPAHRLRPVVSDYSVYVGDAVARMEILTARNAAEREKAE